MSKRREAATSDWRPIDGRLLTDPEAPCATTASGRNPWPAIWSERLQAGEPLLPEQETAARAWLAGERLPAPEVREIW